MDGGNMGLLSKISKAIKMANFNRQRKAYRKSGAHKRDWHSYYAHGGKHAK